MKLSDVMSAASSLTSYAEVALVIFIGVFLGVALDLVRAGQRHEAMRLLPLSDEETGRRSERHPGARS
jgi:hypothetical protein